MEIWQATRPIVQKSKKSYTRKTKHKNKENYKL
jgi:stalled ribosome alternative rescue factor ArfA